MSLLFIPYLLTVEKKFTFNPEYTTDGILGFIGSFAGVLAAFYLANKTLTKTFVMDNQNFVKSFSISQIHINNFIFYGEKLTTVFFENSHIRENPHDLIHFVKELQDSLEQSLKQLNIEGNLDDYPTQDIHEELLMKISEKVPLYCHQEVFKLFFLMMTFYNQMVDELKNKGIEGELVRIKSLPFSSEVHYDVIFRDFKKQYKKAIKKVKA